VISPHTPPGTLLVCRTVGSVKVLPQLVVGRVYTLAEIVIDCEPGPFGVELVETSAEHRRLHFDGWKLWLGRYEWSYDPECFELAVLPKCLREIASKAPRRQTEPA
jgi:hypothetical protein